MGRRTSATASWTTLALAVGLSACVAGPSGPSPTDPHGFTTTSPESLTTLTVDQSLGAFRDCLQDRGIQIEPVEMDALGRPRLAEAFDGPVADDEQVLDGLRHCGHHLGAGALDLSGDPELRDLVQDSLQELAHCLRSWGVADFPDPVPGFDGVGSPFPSGLIPWTDPDLPTAVRNCRDGTS